MGPLAVVAGEFAELGLLDEAADLLSPLGWGGTVSDAGYAVVLGDAHEGRLDPELRRRLGVHYTPLEIASGLASMAMCDVPAHARVGDLSCGAGAFLVAAAEVLCAAGASPSEVIAGQLFGADIDATAVRLARLELARWGARRTGRVHVVPESHLIVADSLGGTRVAAGPGPEGLLDVVIGNPPFGSQLKGPAVRTAGDRRRRGQALGIDALGYADTAGLFLLSAMEAVTVGGVVSLILPDSIPAARDAAVIREAALRRGVIRRVWTGGHDVGFDAAVGVWAPVFQVGSRGGVHDEVVRHHGVDFTVQDRVRAPVDSDDWVPLIAGGPEVSVSHMDRAMSSGALGEVADVRAGFRRQFYGLVPFVHDGGDRGRGRPALVTTGAIDPLHHRADDRLRFAGSHWTRPTVDLEALAAQDPTLATWFAAVAAPKVLVASQGRVIEAVLDADGMMVPSTPVIAVVPRAGAGCTPAHVAALLCAPIVSAWLHRAATGTGMGQGTCRVTARFVSTIPLPRHRDAWDEAAVAAADATAASAAGDATSWDVQLTRLGALMNESYGLGVDDPVLEWWQDQRPGWRGARPLGR